MQIESPLRASKVIRGAERSLERGKRNLKSMEKVISRVNNEYELIQETNKSIHQYLTGTFEDEETHKKRIQEEFLLQKQEEMQLLKTINSGLSTMKQQKPPRPRKSQQAATMNIKKILEGNSYMGYNDYKQATKSYLSKLESNLQQFSCSTDEIQKSQSFRSSSNPARFPSIKRTHSTQEIILEEQESINQGIKGKQLLHKIVKSTNSNTETPQKEKIQFRNYTPDQIHQRSSQERKKSKKRVKKIKKGSQWMFVDSNVQQQSTQSTQQDLTRQNKFKTQQI